MQRSQKKLIQWFLENQRAFPWRQDRSPYSIWVSEMMLQQTQASVVIPYFIRWMDRFPTIDILAETSIEQVIKLWEGLGYYSRARYLHAGAKYIVEELNGKFPDTKEELKKIKGLGPYTIGAILSLAYNQKEPAVDGNVIRVLTRFYGIADDIAKQTTIKKLNLLADSLLPDDQSALFNEMLIELGATVCKKVPNCNACPVQSHCKAYAQNLIAALPYKSKKVMTEHLYRVVAIIHYKDHFLVKRGEKDQIMSDLYQFPYFSKTDESDITKQILAELNIDATWLSDLPDVTHTFTRYKAHLFPAVFSCDRLNHNLPSSYEWLTLSELTGRPFSSGHKRILSSIINQ